MTTLVNPAFVGRQVCALPLCGLCG